ncbi:MAG: acetate/propionate family kinase [Parachlamydiaceae bacterium]
MDIILVFNAGSTSLKFSLFPLEKSSSAIIPLTPSLKGLIEEKENGYLLTLERTEGKETIFLEAGHLHEVVTRLHAHFPQLSIAAVGHRIVHGGEEFTQPTLLGPRELERLKAISFLAPLHNPKNLEGIRIAMELFPSVPQVAVFDTAFHSQISLINKIYPIPYQYFEKGIKRYGFHGINHQYCMEKLVTFIEEDFSKKKLITCHLGGGASLAAIYGGRSVDTTMGFTPLEGLMMSTRSGSIDPGILLFLLEDQKLQPHELNDLLNKQSGLKGICAFSDIRQVLEARQQGDDKAALAIDLYLHSLIKNIAAMATSLGGIDLLVFSGGIGENVAEIRERACEGLAWLGIEIDKHANAHCKNDQKISSQKSKVGVYRIHANEEWLIAKETFSLAIAKH